MDKLLTLADKPERLHNATLLAGPVTAYVRVCTSNTIPVLLLFSLGLLRARDLVRGCEGVCGLESPSTRLPPSTASTPLLPSLAPLCLVRGCEGGLESPSPRLPPSTTSTPLLLLALALLCSAEVNTTFDSVGNESQTVEFLLL